MAREPLPGQVSIQPIAARPRLVDEHQRGRPFRLEFPNQLNTAPVHQGYIEPHATLASVSEDGSAEVWCSTQGHFIVRAHCARLLGMDISKIRVTASEIGGGGFGGKTVV